MTLNTESLLLSRSDVKQCIDMAEVVTIVDAVFKAHGEGKVVMPAKITLDMSSLGIHNYMIPMPAYVEPAGMYGIKWAGGFIDNPSQYDLPFVMATLTLNDPQTGIPLAMMDAMEITNMRTGASAAVAARHLARPDSEVVTFIGCGDQASTSLQALNEVFDLREIRAVDINPKAGKRLVEEGSDLGIEGHVIEDNEEAVRGADIIVTATTAAEPLVMKDWVTPGTFIGKLGSYQELDDELTLNASKIVVDHREQNEHRGELVHLFDDGRITQEDIYGELGEIVAGTLPGRDEESEVIVAALIGMGTEDVAVGAAVLKRARELGIGKRFDFLA
jgi:ornithine cyclodeaminase/alanine dehydrogenase